jgi:magnesium-transporting ATPase (P-type)
VNFARFCGYVFKGIDREDRYHIEINGVPKTYKVLHILEFNSKRKRMSIIFKTEDGSILLLTKGADSIISKRLATGQNDDLEVAVEALEDYGKEGLRTLMLAQRVVPQAEFDKWEEAYKIALSSMKDREEKIEDQQDLIEVELEFVGCTAIEDKLQDEVPQTIDLLLKNNIKVWVLTGDKGNFASSSRNCHDDCLVLQSDRHLYRSSGGRRGR